MDVETPLGTLKCTLGAAKRINGLYGGFVEATRRIMSFDFDAYPAVIGAALDKKPADIEDEVYGAGMETLLQPLLKYLGLLSNGGKESKKADAEAAKSGEA